MKTYSHSKIIFIIDCLYIFLISVIFLPCSISAKVISKEKIRVEHLFNITNGKNKTDMIVAPRDIFITDKELYVIDKINKEIKIFDVFGGFLFAFPLGKEHIENTGIEVDASGYIYLCEPVNNSIAVFDNRGKFYSYISFQDVPNTENFLPICLSISLEGNIYIGDSNIKRVVVLNDKYEFLYEIKGIDDKQKFLSISDILLDKNGNLYIIDIVQGCIFVFDKNGKFVKKFGKKGSGNGLLSSPVGISILNNEFIFVSDTTKHSILVYDNEYNFIFEFGGFGNKDGYFNFPAGIVIDSKNRIFIADNQNNRIQVLQINTLQ